METAIPLKDFLHEYGESMAEKVTKELTVIHDPLQRIRKKGHRRRFSRT